MSIFVKNNNRRGLEKFRKCAKPKVRHSNKRCIDTPEVQNWVNQALGVQRLFENKQTLFEMSRGVGAMTFSLLKL